jgi:hypothetical protein
VRHNKIKKEITNIQKKKKKEEERIRLKQNRNPAEQTLSLVDPCLAHGSCGW